MNRPLTGRSLTSTNDHDQVEPIWAAVRLPVALLLTVKLSVEIELTVVPEGKKRWRTGPPSVS
jgi:hypothetical protein